jgi:nucleotide-binding universal stress UspA family protein
VLLRTDDANPHLLAGGHLDGPVLEDPEAYLKEQVGRLEASGLVAELVVPPGGAPEALVAEIRNQQPDLVVVVTRRHPGLGGKLFGGLADTIIAARVAPVLVVGERMRNGEPGLPLRGARVIVPLDGLPLGEVALPTALDLARSLHGQIILFQAVAEPILPYAVPEELRARHELDVELAWEPSYALRAARAYLQRVANRLARDVDGLHIGIQVRLGGVAEQMHLIQTGSASSDSSAPGLSLIVMATHGRLGLGRFLLGSTMAEVVHSVDVPVLAVPARDPPESSATLRPEHVGWARS